MTMFLLSSAGRLPPAAAQAPPAALEVRGVDTADFPTVRLKVTVSEESAPAQTAPPAFRLVEEGGVRPVEVRSTAGALAVAIVVDNRTGPDPGQLRGLRNAAVEFALRLADDAQVWVLGTATVPPTPEGRPLHPVGAIAALEPGTDGDPREVLQRAVSQVSVNPSSYPVVVWLGTEVDGVGDAVDGVRSTRTTLYALTLGQLEQPPFEKEVRATGGLSVAGSAADLRRAAGEVAGDLDRTYLLSFTVREDGGAMKIMLEGIAPTDQGAEVQLVSGAFASPRPASGADGWLVAVAAVLVVVDIVAVARYRMRYGLPAPSRAGVSNVG